MAPDRYAAVITVGRICPQKDPEYFLDAHHYYKVTGGTRVWVWVGGPGEDESNQELVAKLTRADIVVTGWLAKHELEQWYKHAWLYVHTAAWEGFPVSILEAATYHLPIVARDIPAVSHEGVEPLTTSPQHMAGWVQALEDPYQYRRGVARSSLWLRARQGDQAEALRKVYGIAEST